MAKSNKTELPSNSDVENVTLETPIKRGEILIDSLEIRKPKTGSLRGIALSDLLKLEVDSIIRVVPRISSPAITEQEVAELDAPDLVAVSTAVVSFFVPKQTSNTPEM